MLLPGIETGRRRPRLAVRSRTSIEAAKQAEPRAGSQRGKIYAYLVATGGATRDKISADTGIKLQSVCARVAELIGDGWAHHTSELGVTSGGSRAEVIRPIRRS